MTNPCCSLAVIFCGFILHLIGRETINIPEIFSGVHGFMGMTVNFFPKYFAVTETTFRDFCYDNIICKNVNYKRECSLLLCGKCLLELCTMVV